MSGSQRCTPLCRFFRCAKRALMIRGNKAWCRWVNDECDPARCSFATCAKRRLLPDGRCGEKIKRITREVGPEAIEAIKVPDRVLKKLGVEEVVY